MILGGAQENTLLCCRDLLRDYGDDVLLITGPALGPEGSLLEKARGWGVPIFEIPEMRRAVHPWRDFVAYRKLLTILREFQPHVVHTHSAKAGILGRRAAWKLGAPAIVHTVHGAPYHPYQPAPARWFVRICEIYAAKRCHAMISVADAMTDLLAGDGVAARDKFTTIYSGMEVAPFLQADTHRDETRRELGYADDHCVVGKIARLFHLKGHEDLIRAAETIVREAPHVRFLLVGDGILRSRLEAEIAHRGLTEYFRFVGLVPPEKLPAYLGAMDVVVHTSLREGLARVLPQALLAGKPVVSYDIDGAREVVLEDETGHLIPPRNISSLSRAIISLAGDAQKRHRFGRRGRELCKMRFCHQQMTRQIRTLYESILQEREGATDFGTHTPQHRAM